MPSRPLFLALFSLLLVAIAVSAAPASARWYGSTLKGPANATYGCEAAMVSTTLSGIVPLPSNQTSCTYRHGGYLFTNRPTFLVPASGRITKIRVKSGANPATLRLVVLSGSARVDTVSGQDLPGTYTCCTAVTWARHSSHARTRLPRARSTSRSATSAARTSTSGFTPRTASR